MFDDRGIVQMDLVFIIYLVMLGSGQKIFIKKIIQMLQSMGISLSRVMMNGPSAIVVLFVVEVGIAWLQNYVPLFVESLDQSNVDMWL